jgi:hypothetical protein
VKLEMTRKKWKRKNGRVVNSKGCQHSDTKGKSSSLSVHDIATMENSVASAVPECGDTSKEPCEGGELTDILRAARVVITPSDTSR